MTDAEILDIAEAHGIGGARIVRHHHPRLDRPVVSLLAGHGEAEHGVDMVAGENDAAHWKSACVRLKAMLDG